MDKLKIAVIGAGSWGTAISLLLVRNGLSVTLWAHRKEHVDQLKLCNENKTYLPGFKLSSHLCVTPDINEAIHGASFIIMVVPSHVFRSVFSQIKKLLTTNQIVVSASKGIENDSLLTMTQLMSSEFPLGQYAVLSGPSFAKEVAAGKPTAVTVAAQNISVAKAVQDIFFSGNFRVYTSNDVIGVELGVL